MHQYEADRRFTELDEEIRYLKNKIDDLYSKVESFASKHTLIEFIISEIQKGQYWKSDLDVLKHKVSFLEEDIEKLNKFNEKISKDLEPLKEFKQVIKSMQEYNFKLISIGISLMVLISGLLKFFVK
jgi:prefoldin subunit 5